MIINNFISYLDINNLNLIFVFTGIILSLLVSLAAWYNIKQKKSWYLLLIFIYIISSADVILTNNWFHFMISWEMVTLTTTLLLLWNGHDIALKYFIIQFIGSSFLLFTVLMAINQGYTVVGPVKETWLQNMFVLGLGMKSAIIGLHFWIPLIYKKASPLFCAISSGWVVKLGFITYLKIISDGNTFLLYTGIIMIFYGGIKALLTSDYKLLLGYSTISQLGYIALGIASGTTYGYYGAILHVIAHSLAKTTLFINGEYWLKECGSCTIHKLSFSIKRQNINSITAFFCFVSLMGFPLLAGYNSKHLIKYAYEENVILILMLYLASVITYMYAIRFLWFSIFKENKIKFKKYNFRKLVNLLSNMEINLLNLNKNLVLLIPVIILILLGLFPNYIFNFIEETSFDFHIFNGLAANLIYLFLASRLFFIKYLYKKN